mmetsp:Transcript_9652/g.9369  ORF Transcript_9652/g.9369 Transcript_9652/m.9369 type:complete len:259 (-) Transcript_9652:8-784(-)
MNTGLDNLENLLSVLSLKQRKVICRLWAGDNDRKFYNLNAASFQALDEAALSTFQLRGDEDISFYYLLDKQDVESRHYISNDDQLNDYFKLAGNTFVFVWLRGDSDYSPGSLPSIIEIKVASIASSPSSISTNRGHVQKLFRNSVRRRDNCTCVLSGKKLKQKANNVQAAHVIGVEPGLYQLRQEAGITNSYDTGNGILLETSLHSSFDSFLWCMDQFGVVHVSDKGIEQGLGKWAMKKVSLDIGNFPYPSEQMRLRK